MSGKETVKKSLFHSLNILNQSFSYIIQIIGMVFFCVLCNYLRHVRIFGSSEHSECLRIFFQLFSNIFWQIFAWEAEHMHVCHSLFLCAWTSCEKLFFCTRTSQLLFNRSKQPERKSFHRLAHHLITYTLEMFIVWLCDIFVTMIDYQTHQLLWKSSI